MSLNYDPQTATKMKMIAKVCACCAQPLCDAKSVEIGIGPVCRKKHGYGYCDELTDAQRKEANELIYLIAIDQTGPKVVEAAERLFDLGFYKLVARIMQRISQVVIAVEDDRLAIKTPYKPEAVAVFQKVNGRKWDKVRKVNTFPASEKVAVYAVLKAHYAGLNAIGPKGPFVIPSPGSAGPKMQTPVKAAEKTPHTMTPAQALLVLTDKEVSGLTAEELNVPESTLWNMAQDVLSRAIAA